MEYLEDNKYFYEYSLLDVLTPDAGKSFYSYEGNESAAGGGDKLNP